MIGRSVNYVNMPQKILSVFQRYEVSVLLLTLWKNGCEYIVLHEDHICLGPCIFGSLFIYSCLCNSFI